jgi:hypothetical protein
MNARAAFCFDSYVIDAHVAAMSATAAAADRADDVSDEIVKAMHSALCEGKAAAVPAVRSDDTEGDKPAFDVLFDHIGDDKAAPLLLALLRTDCAEARALVKYAAEQHANFNADDIAHIRAHGELL